jgi:hypothetical protein
MATARRTHGFCVASVQSGFSYWRAIFTCQSVDKK